MNWNDIQVQEGSPRLREGSPLGPPGGGGGENLFGTLGPPGQRAVDLGGPQAPVPAAASAVLAAIPHLVPFSCCPGLCLPPNLSVMQSHELKKNGELDQIHNSLRTEQQQSVWAFR